MENFTIPVRAAGLGLRAAMITALLAGCSTHSPLASSGQPTLSESGTVAQSDSAIARLEAKVAKSPDTASLRADLAQAYLAAGRFDSSVTTFEDAVSLGEDNARTGLGQALAYIGAGRSMEAMTVLNRWRNQIPASDLGLAIALAGEPAQGVDLLSGALRGGDDTAKTRQNLAYAYALDGRWAEARVVASQDVPADQLDTRLREWASRARPEQYQARIAGLLGVPVRLDPGQPVGLALGGAEQPAQFASAEMHVPAAPAAELDAVTAPAAAIAAADIAVANVPVANGSADSRHMASFEDTFAPAGTETAAAQPAVASPFIRQPKPERVEPTRSALAVASGSGSHLVQLGSFSTLDGAKRAWGIFVSRNPSLKDHAMRITEAEVRGRRYFRVAADGFESGSANALCNTVRQRGGACIAYASSRSLPGALPGSVQNGTMLAKR